MISLSKAILENFFNSLISNSPSLHKFYTFVLFHFLFLSSRPLHRRLSITSENIFLCSSYALVSVCICNADVLDFSKHFWNYSARIEIFIMVAYLECWLAILYMNFLVYLFV